MNIEEVRAEQARLIQEHDRAEAAFRKEVQEAIRNGASVERIECFESHFEAMRRETYYQIRDLWNRFYMEN